MIDGDYWARITAQTMQGLTRPSHDARTDDLVAILRTVADDRGPQAALHYAASLCASIVTKEAPKPTGGYRRRVRLDDTHRPLPGRRTHRGVR